MIKNKCLLLIIILALLQVLDVGVTLAAGTQYEVNPFANLLFAQQYGMIYVIIGKAFIIAYYVVADYLTRIFTFARPILAIVLSAAVMAHSVLFVWNIYCGWAIWQS